MESELFFKCDCSPDQDYAFVTMLGETNLQIITKRIIDSEDESIQSVVLNKSNTLKLFDFIKENYNL